MWRVAVSILALFALGGCHVFGPKPAAARTTALSQMKQLALGQVMYHNDYDEATPLVDWRPLTFPYVKNHYVYENRRAANPHIFAHRATLINRKVATMPIPAQTALLMDVMASSDPFLAELPAMAYREYNGAKPGVAMLGFVDGHAKSYRKGTAAMIK